jgi:hypothetical protein
MVRYANTKPDVAHSRTEKITTVQTTILQTRISKVPRKRVLWSKNKNFPQGYEYQSMFKIESSNFLMTTQRSTSLTNDDVHSVP